MGPFGMHIRHSTLFIHAVLKTSPVLVPAGCSRLRHPPEPALKAERPARFYILPALGSDRLPSCAFTTASIAIPGRRRGLVDLRPTRAALRAALVQYLFPDRDGLGMGARAPRSRTVPASA